MNAKQAREMVDRAKGRKSFDEYVEKQLAVDNFLAEIKYLSSEGVSELLFDPLKHKGFIKERLETLGFTFEKRGEGANKQDWIVW